MVAILGSAHGLKGEVKLDVRTDVPERRLRPGAVVETVPPEAGPLTITRTRQYKGAWYAMFEEIRDRTTVENLRGISLVVETDEVDDDEPDAWYAHELTGLEVLDTEGWTLGEVTGLEPMPAHDLLVVTEPDGTEVRVPFVKDIVIEVDPEDNCIVVDPPGGLFTDEDADDDADLADEPDDDRAL